MSGMSIQLFGQFCIRRKEQLLGGFEAHKVPELFCYILLHRQHSLPRESLAGLLWADSTTTQSKKRLRQVFWHLQTALGSQSEPVHDRILLVEPDRVQNGARLSIARPLSRLGAG
jgi:DNA-binding SARP family transcriptional activator